MDQFRAVTGAPSDVARSILEACGGNLELAVNMHMEGGGPSSSPVATPGPSREPDRDLGPTSDELLSPTSYEAKSVSQSFTVYVKQRLNIVAVLVRPMSCTLFIPILCLCSIQTWYTCSHSPVEWCADRGQCPTQ